MLTDETFNKIERLREWVNESSRIVFFGGAGVSTESGIPDFRSTGGLYQQEWNYPPETILSHTFYESNPEEFFRFYRAKMVAPGAKPNAAHLKLAEWEKTGKLTAVITQNIDGLTRRREAVVCMNCTAACIAITVSGAERFMGWSIFWKQPAFRAASAAEL